MSILSILTGFFLLVVGGEYIVRASVSLSLRFKISKFAIGMTVVALATSFPELIVSVNAALSGSPSIAINNVIGSNIANIGLVLSIVSILSFVTVNKNFYKRDWPIMFLFSLQLLIFAMNDNLISQIEGATLILTILLFIYFSLQRKEASVNDENFNIPKVSKFKILFWLIISSISLYAGSEFLVDGAVKLAKELSISEAVISVSVIAIGTSVPELATSVVAIVKKEKGISVGNILGSNIFNIGSVLGITSLIKPVIVSQEIFERDIVWMILFAILLILLAIIPKKNHLGKMKGAILLILYFYFLYVAYK
jgi:cation:H+ antiporter